jgi:hypothetical protein
MVQWNDDSGRKQTRVVDVIPARQLLPVTRAYAARAICPNCRLNNCDNCALSSAKVYILK